METNSVHLCESCLRRAALLRALPTVCCSPAVVCYSGDVPIFTNHQHRQVLWLVSSLEDVDKACAIVEERKMQTETMSFEALGPILI